MTDRDDWDGHWERYAASAARNPAQQMRHRFILGRLRASAPTPNGRGMRLLDLGSGQGDLLVLAHAALPQAELAGFELSRSGVEISRRKVPAAQLEVVDVFAPPPVAQTFQGWATHAVCSEVLEHVDDPAAFLRAASAYLAPGATLIITVPGGPMSAFDRHIGHRRHFTRESIADVARAGGFDVVRAYRVGFPFFNLYRLMVVARGERLATDVESGQRGGAARAAEGMMAVFRGLFRLNLTDCPGGWQIAAVVRKADGRGH
jgi:SAM-dependent methyltransferase